MGKIDRESLQKVYARNREEWRSWLAENHDKEPAVWLYLYNKSSGEESIDWDAAVDEALCFGWIDSVVNRIDDRVRRQYFSPRKPKGNWSKINKAKIERLTAEGRMAPAGIAAVERAKANGSWETLDKVEAMEMPDDLAAVLAAHPKARPYFDSLSKTRRWEMLYWLNGAKRETTRAERIRQIAEAAAEERRPDRFRQ
jgi:uncharacterized protein YdeI (YjbR/CyaY-like superfamily)